MVGAAFITFTTASITVLARLSINKDILCFPSIDKPICQYYYSDLFPSRWKYPLPKVSKWKKKNRFKVIIALIWGERDTS